MFYGTSDSRTTRGSANNSKCAAKPPKRKHKSIAYSSYAQQGLGGFES